jgi:hypothetical protein
MSEVAQGPGWWQASDGKWYPPQQAPQQAPQWTPAPAGYGYGAAGSRQVGKTRNPWGAWGLSLITFGVYYVVWWFRVNREVHDYEPSIEVEPGLAAVALFVPIANIVTIVKTGGRIGRAQQAVGSAERCSGGIGFLLAILLATHIVYYQSQLNTIWARYGSPPEGTRV